MPGRPYRAGSSFDEVSTYVGRVGPVNVHGFSYRRRYLAVYDDALVYVRLNAWEDADLAMAGRGQPLAAGRDSSSWPASRDLRTA